MVLQDCLHAGQRCVSCSFPQAVDGGVQTLAATQYGCQHVTHREVVIIVGMEVETQFRIGLDHAFHIVESVVGVKNAECVGQHKAFHWFVAQCVH